MEALIYPHTPTNQCGCEPISPASYEGPQTIRLWIRHFPDLSLSSCPFDAEALYFVFSIHLRKWIISNGKFPALLETGAQVKTWGPPSSSAASTQLGLLHSDLPSFFLLARNISIFHLHSILRYVPELYMQKIGCSYQVYAYLWAYICYCMAILNSFWWAVTDSYVY